VGAATLPTSRRWATLLAIALLVATQAAAAAYAAGPAPASTAEPPEKAPSLTDVNKQLTNPVSELWSITFQQNNFRLTYHFPGEDGTRWSSNLLFQPVLPIAISPKWNLVSRPVIPLFASQPHPQETDPSNIHQATAFGDITFMQLVSPSARLVGGWLLGAGPTWMFPTAGSRYTGSGKYQVGPAAIVGYLSDKWIAGALFQDWWSFAGRDDRASTRSMNLQPFASYFLRDGWSVGYSGNILADWEAKKSDDVWTVPIGVAVAKVVKLGKLPVRLALAVQYIPIHPQEFGQTWNLQLTVAPVLPKLVKGNLSDPKSLRFGLGR
jgi:hypothetical protein